MTRQACFCLKERSEICTYYSGFIFNFLMNWWNLNNIWKEVGWGDLPCKNTTRNTNIIGKNMAATSRSLREDWRNSSQQPVVPLGRHFCCCHGCLSTPYELFLKLPDTPSKIMHSISIEHFHLEIVPFFLLQSAFQYLRLFCYFEFRYSFLCGQ